MGMIYNLIESRLLALLIWCEKGSILGLMVLVNPKKCTKCLKLASYFAF